jgi:hypothetical protein
MTMDSLAAAVATADAVGTIGAHFMLDGNTYKRGAELGFSGLDFYVAGRGGVLGDVDADVVSAAFTFFEPAAIRTMWEQGTAVMPGHDASREFSACCSAWAEEHVPDDLDSARLAELAGRVVVTARPACASVFAGWRALQVPESPKARAVHLMNCLRELRLGVHGAAVVAAGLSPHQALSIRSPHMVQMFGWAELAEVTGLQERWDAAEERTDHAIAHAYDDLDDAERDELAELAGALHEATP